MISFNAPDQIAQLVASHPCGVAYGNGRSYGDVCLNPDGVLWHTIGLDHLVAFDRSTGRLVCESGVLLRDIQRLVIPWGWILPITPGTQLVTVGGAIANDVHGKNHHALGSFGDHVQRIRLLRTDGQIIECSSQNHSDWFAATVGGVGLTGIIVHAEIQLSRVVGPWMTTETVPYANLGEFFQLVNESKADWQHAVAWIDCFSASGRGLFMRGNPIDVGDRPEPNGRMLTMPFVPSASLVNPLTLQAFNMAYFHLKKRQAGCATMHYESFFYPLDRLLEWNRIYGLKGFFQYQSVVPKEVMQDATQAMLNEIARAGEGSFLAVLKTFGDRQPVGMMSFPRPGITLAMDFPNRGGRTKKLFERLDAVVREAGGRIYLAKDACMSRELFEAGYPHLNEFLKYRDPGISSGLSRRLMGS
nr:FAD-binding oxidoreductase [uncultured Rhodoferax sp.]